MAGRKPAVVKEEPPPIIATARIAKPKDYRCAHCGKLIFRAVITKAYIETRCPRCGRISQWETPGNGSKEMNLITA